MGCVTEKGLETIDISMAGPLEMVTGEAYFEALTCMLGEALHADQVLILEFSKERNTGTVVTAWDQSASPEDYSFALSSTLLSQFNQKPIFHFDDSNECILPELKKWLEGGYRTITGVALNNPGGEPSGMLCVMTKGDVKDLNACNDLLELVASRASAELERLRYERDLVNKNKALEESNRNKSIFIANVSHEIRSPLNSILGFAQLLEKSDLTNKQNSYLSILTKSGRSLLNLIDDLLDISRMEAGLLQLESQPFCPSTLMNDLMEELQVIVKDKPVELIIGSDQPKELYFGDRKRIKQVLRNLVVNAIKFTDQGTVQVDLIAAPDGFVFKVIDTGIGISHEMQQQIFSRFVQVENDKPNYHKGTGLGLAISKELIELMGG